MNKEQISRIDKDAIWHPLTQHKTAAPPLIIDKASGNYIYDIDGNKYLDAISSWYTCSYGHAHPQLIAAITTQAQRLHHVVFAGMTHEPAAQLAANLLNILPYNQDKVFFSENGSTSVEIALKMAFQYHANHGDKRTTVIALENGFHGDTFGAMSASSLSVYNGAFEDFFIDVKRIPAPTNENIEVVLTLIDELVNDNKVASFIYEPLVQGAAAMQMHDAQALCRVLLRFRESGILTIADEVMTGFGKTGKNFASDHLLNKPDIMCLSKALTAGMMPMAVTTCTSALYDAFYSDNLEDGFFHGHTYTGNPLGCAVASAGIKLLKSPAIQESMAIISQSHLDFIEDILPDDNITAARSFGIILAIDLNIQIDRYGKERDRILNYFMSQGVFLRPLGKTIYIVPPFTITSIELDSLYSVIKSFVASL